MVVVLRGITIVCLAGTGTYWSDERLNVCNAAAVSATACPLH
jgi:hypothetical protein